MPGHHQRGRVTDEVVEIVKSPLLIFLGPPVQFALDPEYPRLRSFERRPRRAAIQRRPPRLPDTDPQAHCLPSPRAGLSPAPTTTETPPRPVPSADAAPDPLPT